MTKDKGTINSINVTCDCGEARKLKKEDYEISAHADECGICGNHIEILLGFNTPCPSCKKYTDIIIRER